MTTLSTEDQVERCFVKHDNHSWPCVGCKQTRDNIAALFTHQRTLLLEELLADIGKTISELYPKGAEGSKFARTTLRDTITTLIKSKMEETK